MDKSSQITRTCSSCGLPKPISAFLQLSGTQGTIYGTICATCRSKQAKSGPAKPQDEEWSTTTTGLRIGIKEKTFIEDQKIREAQLKKEAEQKELKKRESKATETTQREDLKKKQDSERRQFFLEIKKVTTPPITEKPAQKPGQRPDLLTRPEVLQEIKQIQDLLLNDTQFRKGEIGSAPINFNELRFNTAIFLQFIESFLTDASPIKRFLQNNSKKPTAFMLNQQVENNKRQVIKEIEQNIKENYQPPSSSKKF